MHVSKAQTSSLTLGFSALLLPFMSFLRNDVYKRKHVSGYYFFYSNSCTLLHTLKTPIHINT